MAVRIEFERKRTPLDKADRGISRLTALAVKVFGDPDKARRWLRRPRREFGGISPLEMMETEAAARQVEALLQQMDEDHE